MQTINALLSAWHDSCAYSVLTLLAGRQEEYPAIKKQEAKVIWQKFQAAIG